MAVEELTIELLQEVTGQILEEAAFVFSEQEESEWPPGESIFQASIPFTGEFDGTMTVAAGEAFVSSLAANLLGLDFGDEATPSQGKDAIGEILNIVGGALLGRWFGSDHTYNMGVPTVIECDAETHQKTVDGASVWLIMLCDEEHRLDIGVTLS